MCLDDSEYTTSSISEQDWIKVKEGLGLKKRRGTKISYEEKIFWYSYTHVYKARTKNNTL